MVNKPLIRPYFWGGGTLGGGWLISHDRRGQTSRVAVFFSAPLNAECFWSVASEGLLGVSDTDIAKKSNFHSLKPCLYASK